MWAARFSAAASIPPANAGTSPSTPPMREITFPAPARAPSSMYRHLRQLPQFPHGARRTEIHAHHRPYDGRKYRKQPAFGHRRGGELHARRRDGDNVHGTGTGRVAGPAGGTSRIRRPAHLCRRERRDENAHLPRHGTIHVTSPPPPKFSVSIPYIRRSLSGQRSAGRPGAGIPCGRYAAGDIPQQPSVPYPSGKEVILQVKCIRREWHNLCIFVHLSIKNETLCRA